MIYSVMPDAPEQNRQDEVSNLARSILKHIQVESQNNIPLATAACGSVAMYLLAITTADKNEQQRFVEGLQNELSAFNQAREQSSEEDK